MSLAEMERHWSIDDLEDAHDALDLWEDLEAAAAEEQERTAHSIGSKGR